MIPERGYDPAFFSTVEGEMCLATRDFNQGSTIDKISVANIPYSEIREIWSKLNKLFVCVFLDLLIFIFILHVLHTHIYIYMCIHYMYYGGNVHVCVIVGYIDLNRRLLTAGV